MLEFPVTLVVTETHVFIYVLESISSKNDVTLFIVNVTRLYVIDDVMKIKLATEWRHTCPCSDLSTNKSLNLTIGYMGDQC